MSLHPNRKLGRGGGKPVACHFLYLFFCFAPSALHKLPLGTPPQHLESFQWQLVPLILKLSNRQPEMVGAKEKFGLLGL